MEIAIGLFVFAALAYLIYSPVSETKKKKSGDPREIVVGNAWFYDTKTLRK